MQFQVMRVPVSDSAQAVEDLNRILRGCRVVRVERELVVDGANSFWTFCVEYLEGPSPIGRLQGKVDYREVLSPQQFERFARLRVLRKELADKEAVPVYAIFTNEQLAQMVRLEQPSKKGVEAIQGIGAAKMEKYGEIRTIRTVMGGSVHDERISATAKSTADILGHVHQTSEHHGLRCQRFRVRQHERADTVVVRHGRDERWIHRRCDPGDRSGDVHGRF